MQSFLVLLRRHARTVAVFGLIGLAIALAVVFFHPGRHGATVRLLVVPRAGTDAASVSRSAAVLARIAFSTDFFTAVAAQDPQVSWADFGVTDAARRRAWQKALRTRVEPGLGVLTVTAVDRDADRAGRIAQAVADVLVHRGADYIGDAQTVRLLDAPLVD